MDGATALMDGATAPMDGATAPMPESARLFPANVASHLGLDPNAIATIEVTHSSSKLYSSVLQYAACHAVPLDESFPGTDDDRETTVRSLWNSPADNDFRLGNMYTDSDSDGSCSDGSDDDERVAEVNAAVREALKECGVDDMDEDLHVVGKSCGLRKRAALQEVPWQAGLGYAKVNVGDAVTYLYHYARGNPVKTHYGVQMFRAVTLAGEDMSVLKDFCAVALKWNHDREQQLIKTKDGKYALYRLKVSRSGRSWWSNEGLRRGRPINSVILQKGQLYSIIRDVKEFMSTSTKEWYQKHGLPHRRSLLFHGVPGTGKTSSIRVLAGLFGLNACFLSVTGHNFNNQTLQDAIAHLPSRALLVVEDCDALFNADRKVEGQSALTFSAFLNCLDGLCSTDGIVTVLTTNHVEKLDPALIRGGRVDRRFEFFRADQKQIADLFMSFYKDAPHSLARKFASCVFERKESEAKCIATLQQHFIYTRKRSAEECVEALPEFFAEFYPKGVDQQQSLYM